MAERVVKLSDVQKLQQTVETFQTVLQSISKGDEDSVRVADSGASGSGTRWLASGSSGLADPLSERRKDRFDRALDSARETLRKARSQFQNAAIATEHKELFGYRGKSGKGKEKKSRPSPWTKQFYCLAYCDQTRVPTGDEELDELYHAGLGMKKITIPDMNTVTNTSFRKIITDNFPKLSHGGGFEFLRCVPNTKQLEVFSELAQANPTVLQERSQKGKIFIRPVQSDLVGPPEKKLHVQNQTEELESEDEMSEECFHCGKVIPLYQLRAHIQECSARSRSRKERACQSASKTTSEEDVTIPSNSATDKGSTKRPLLPSSDDSPSPKLPEVTFNVDTSSSLQTTTPRSAPFSTYSTFIDLVDSEESDNKGSDEENTEFMELQNAIALSFQKSSIQPQSGDARSILQQHQKDQICAHEEPSLCIAVRRRHVWKDTKLVLSRRNNVYSGGIRVTFISEAAVDEGGPRREFFRLVLAELAQNNALFDGGEQRRIARHNVMELQGNSYLIAGRVFALSLMYGGPAPQFFASPVAEYLLDGTVRTVCIEDVPDQSIQRSLFQLQQVKTEDEMRSLLDGDLFDLRCTCGITVPSKNFKFKDLPELIRSLCLHFVIYTAKSELDQLREGLQVLNLLSVMQSNSTLFMPLFIGSNRPQLTADSLLGLFKVKSWSPEGSNSRECEEAVIFNWQNYVRETEGGRQVQDSTSSAVVYVDLPQILAFVSGADSIPPLGFDINPAILFSTDRSRLLPVASTCALTLTLSVGLVEYDVFQKNMDMAVLNAYEFGQV